MTTTSPELPLSAAPDVDGGLPPSPIGPLLPEDEIEARHLWVWLALDAADALIAAYDAEQADGAA